jgi:hypothetical protein
MIYTSFFEKLYNSINVARIHDYATMTNITRLNYTWFHFLYQQNITTKA